MATVVFDFDSTLIDCESLDELLARALAGQPERIAEVAEITVAGMEGRLEFHESLRQRLAIASPTRADCVAFGREAVDRLTPGMEALVTGLNRRAEVWIVSGALRETVLPAAARLGVPESRILATGVAWSDEGTLERVTECRTKIEHLEPRSEGWARPRIMVGDGITDHAPFAAGLVDHFVAFTAVVRREPVVTTGAPEAASVPELEYLLGRWL
ncbi:MAG: HAD-IB family phosphatase [Planctomycetota bacterium]